MGCEIENREVIVRIETTEQWDAVIAYSRDSDRYYIVSDVTNEGLSAKDGCHSEIDYFEDRPSTYIVLNYHQWLSYGKPKMESELSGCVSVIMEDALFDVKRI